MGPSPPARIRVATSPERQPDTKSKLSFEIHLYIWEKVLHVNYCPHHEKHATLNLVGKVHWVCLAWLSVWKPHQDSYYVNCDPIPTIWHNHSSYRELLFPAELLTSTRQTFVDCFDILDSSLSTFDSRSSITWRKGNHFKVAHTPSQVSSVTSVTHTLLSC